MTDQIRLHNIVYRTKVLGPGERTAVWLQGCLRRCPGCMSESTRPLDGGKVADIRRLCRAIWAQEGIEGITVSGGEPFLQPEALGTFLEQLRQGKDLGVILYTGYTLEQLQEKKDPWVEKILRLTDLLIDGEYVEELNDGVSLRGSSNQRVLFLTERYRPWEQLYRGTVRNAEVRLTGNDVFFVGVPSRETWQQWRSALRQVDRDRSPQSKGEVNSGQ